MSFDSYLNIRTYHIGCPPIIISVFCFFVCFVSAVVRRHVHCVGLCHDDPGKFAHVMLGTGIAGLLRWTFSDPNLNMFYLQWLDVVCDKAVRGFSGCCNLLR